jgi:hypothetical protein
LGQFSMIRAACCLQAHHKVTDLEGQVEPFASPEDFEKVVQWGERHQNALIVSFRISERQGEEIVKRLKLGKSLLGATCGRGFSINTAEEIAIVNEILAPDICIGLDNQKHKWMLQSWPERAEGEQSGPTNPCTRTPR